MTKEQALERIRELSGFEPEHGHSEADKVLCELLRSLGYDEVVDAFEALDRWYA